jgi:hypothetical protein
MKQDMTSQLEDLQQQLAKARNDYSKIEKALAAATDVIEQLKDKEERLTTDYLNLKTRHDQDMANNRRHVAALNREKNDLLKNLEDLSAQLAALQATKNMRKRTPEPGADPDDEYTDEPFSSDKSASNDGIPAALSTKNLNLEETLKALEATNRMIGSLRANIQKEKSEKYELKKLLADSQEQIEAMHEELTDPVFNKRAKKSKRSKRSSAASNGLPNIDENDPLDENEFSGEDDGYDDMDINKNNRPSSDMFRPRGWKPRKSRHSSMMSIKKFDEDISGEEEEEIEDDETVAAQRAEALNNLTSSRSSKSPRLSKDKIINPEIGEEQEDASSVDSFTSANETNSKRGSAASKRESAVSKRISKQSNRESSIPISPGAHDKITPTKEFKHVAIQTENVTDVERSDSLSTVHTGKYTFGNRDTVYDNALHDSKDGHITRQSVPSVHEDNNIDKRFTLDLSSGQRKNKRNQYHGLEPPPRPTNSPPPALMAHANRFTINFGQQAGSSKIPHNPLNLNRKGSTDSQDINNENNAVGSAISTSKHKPTLSSDSISTVSSTSTSAENIRSDSSQVEAGSSVGPMTGPMTGPITGPSGTDPSIIHAITQTMIGEYLWKYTRKNFGAGISEKRHKRFFWVHPYTKTLYWSIKDPGSYEPVDPKSKGGMSYFGMFKWRY